MAELPREDFGRVLTDEAAWFRRMARGRCDDGAIDDLVQEVWLRSVRRRPTAAGALPWLRSMARFLLRDNWRADQRRKRREFVAAQAAQGVDTPEQQLSQAQLHRLVLAELQVMAPARRDVLELRFFEARSPTDIAQQLGLPPGTVRRRLKEGLDELRAALDRHHGGQREAWQWSLVPLLPGAGVQPLAPLRTPARPSWLLAGQLIVAALAGVVLVVGGWFSPSQSPRSAAPRPVAREKALPNPTRVPLHRAPPAAEAHASADQTVTVTGEVRTSDGDPVRGARLTLADVTAREIVASAVSSSDGRFQIAGPRPSRYQITAIGDEGWAAVAMGALAPGTPGHATLLLAPGVATISGRVLNAVTGRALGGAQVGAVLTGGGAERFATVVDDSGVFALKVPRRARYEVYAAAAGYNAVNLFESVTENRVLDLPLQPLAHVKGRIVDAGSRGPVAARLTVASEPTPGEELFVQSADVDATGQFELGIAPGHYRLFAQAGDRFGRASLSIAAGTSATTEIVLRAQSRVRGRVVANDGAGVAGVKVVGRVIAADLAGPSSSAVTDARGNYELVGLPAAEIEVRARAPGFAPTLARMAAGDVAGGQLADLRLQAGAGLRGSVRDSAGRSLVGLVVRASLHPAGGSAPAPAQSVVSDEAGGFFFDGWPAGEVWLAAKAPDGRAAHLGPLTIAPGAIALVDLIVTPAAWIAGRALAADGTPAAHVPIDAVPLGSPAAGGLAASSFTDEAGWFRVGPLPAGRVGVQLGLRRPASAARRGVSPALPSREVTLAPGQELADLALTVPSRDGFISGRVIDQRGVAVASAFVDVHLYLAGGRADLLARGLSDASGHFELRDLPPARVQVRVRHAPLVEELRLADVSSREALTITLRDPDVRLR